MRLQDRLPDGVEVDGKFYKMDFDFRNVLKMIDALDEENLTPEALAYNALHFVCKRPKNVFNVLDAVKALLFTAPRKKAEKRVTDFVQDAPYIRAAFRQAYGIDLYRDKLHWIEFTELLSAIPEGSRYSEIIRIRVRPLPEPTQYNRHEREWLMKAKADVALHMSEKDRERQYQQDVSNIAAMLKLLAKGSENDG